MRKDGSNIEFPPYLLSFISEQLKQITLEHSQNERRRKACTKELWLRIRMVHGKKPYYKKLYDRATYTIRMYRKRIMGDVDAQRGDDVAEPIMNDLGTNDKLNNDHPVIQQTDVHHEILTRTYSSLKIKNSNDFNDTKGTIYDGEQQTRRKRQWKPICHISNNLLSVRQSGQKNVDITDDDTYDMIIPPPSLAVSLLGNDHDHDHPNCLLVANSTNSCAANIATNSNMKKQLQLNIHGFMEIPTSDPTKCLSMCMHCRLVPIRLRFPDSFCVGPMSLCRIQKHRQMCHTSGLDLTATADALDEIIRSDFGNDLNVLQLNSFVEVIRAAVVHETLVTIFTQNLVRLIHTRRGLLCDDDAYDTDPNVVPPNVWQLFPTTVDFNTVEKALQLFVNEVGNINKDNPNFLHFLLMISPGLHAPKKHASK